MPRSSFKPNRTLIISQVTTCPCGKFIVSKGNTFDDNKRDIRQRLHYKVCKAGSAAAEVAGITFTTTRDSGSKNIIQNHLEVIKKKLIDEVEG